MNIGSKYRDIIYLINT